MKSSFLIWIIGIIFFLLGIYLSIFKKYPHFYSFFSIGLVIILLNIYKTLTKKSVFQKWDLKKYSIFSLALVIVCIIIDKIGLALGYWKYQYTTLFDEILKYIFEWAVPFVYFMVALLIGIWFFKKQGKIFSFILSLIIFVTIAGFITEYINLFSYSWEILAMPISNYKIGNFFIVFQTVGYWLMAVITLILYKIVEKIK